MKPAPITRAIKRCKERWYPLTDHPVQLSLVAAVPKGVRFPVVPAGRRCLAEGTMVATPSGPVAIELLAIGDQVIGFDGDAPVVTTVAAVWDNGEQEILDLCSSHRVYLSATNNHKLWGTNEAEFNKRRPHLRKGFSLIEAGSLTKRVRIRRVYLDEMIIGGAKAVPLTYSLGALIGDGCSRDNKTVDGRYQRTIKISSDNEIVPSAMANEIGCSFRKLSSKNYTWAIDVGRGALDVVPFYREWCASRYAHNKVLDWAEVDTWDRPSVFGLLAGLIDTDGAIYYKTAKRTEIIIQIGMQSLSVVDVCRQLIFKYFQEWLTISVDQRDKYKNGPVHSIKTTSNDTAIRILKALRPYLKKKGQGDLPVVSMRNILPDRIGLILENHHVCKTYDITVSLDSNLYVLHHGGIVTSNSGKTERFKRFISHEAVKLENAGRKYFAGAPTHSQAKRIFWADLKDFTYAPTHPRKPSETDLIIWLPNGAEIHVIGFDKPERFEGTSWAGGGIDEFGNLKEDAWKVNILPALDTIDPRTPDYRAWCWLFGVPEGLNHYYDVADYAKNGNDPWYQLFHWKSAEILAPDVIKAAKRTLSAMQFRQEYEASFESAQGKIYSDYSKENVTIATIKPHEQLLWMHDQNYTPLSSAIGVRRGPINKKGKFEHKNYLYLLDEIILTSAVSRQSAEEFVDKFKDHKNKNVIVYGDPAGRQGEKHGQESAYKAIEEVLRLNGWKYDRRVKRQAPAIKDRQNQVRAKVKNALGEVSLFVNPNKAPYCHRGLSTVQLKEGSTFLEEDGEYQHVTTAIGYCIDVEWPIDVELKKVQISGN